MTTLREDPHRAVVLGAGRGGSAVLEMLQQEALVTVVAVVDSNPEAPGLQYARELGITVFDSVEEALHASAPCVAFNLTGNEMVETIASEILGAGGIIGGMEARLLLNMINNLRQAKEALRYEASHDPLTGLYNRRHIMEQLRQGISQALRYHHPFTLVLLDIDHFKQVNDNYGHAAGDRVLTHLSALLKTSVREADIPGRWGGEEFVVMLPHTDLNGATLASGQWLQQLRNSPVTTNADAQSIAVTFSAGVATLNLEEENSTLEKRIESLLHAADEQMYRAKDLGRNRICSAEH